MYDRRPRGIGRDDVIKTYRVDGSWQGQFLVRKMWIVCFRISAAIPIPLRALAVHLAHTLIFYNKSDLVTLS